MYIIWLFISGRKCFQGSCSSTAMGRAAFWTHRTAEQFVNFQTEKNSNKKGKRGSCALAVVVLLSQSRCKWGGWDHCHVLGVPQLAWCDLLSPNCSCISPHMYLTLRKTFNNEKYASFGLEEDRLMLQRCAWNSDPTSFSRLFRETFFEFFLSFSCPLR